MLALLTIYTVITHKADTKHKFIGRKVGICIYKLPQW